jgi:hypothetical protein
MLYRNENGRPPSLLVGDGETVTISATGARSVGMTPLKMRPRTTAALLVLGGRPPSAPPRLTDHGAFETVESTDGMETFAEVDTNGQIGGYSVSFISRMLDLFEPNDPFPPRTVRLETPREIVGEHCGCSAERHSIRIAERRAEESTRHDRLPAKASLPTYRTHNISEVYVPKFIVNLKIYALFLSLGEIIVGFNATLILDDDINFAVADNVLAYHGSRIIQRSDYLNLDVRGIMRGGILFKIHETTQTTVKVDLAALAAQTATKP